MRALLVIMAAALALPASAKAIEGDGRSTTQTRDVASFDTIKLQISADVVVHVGGAQKVAVTADGNLIEHLRTEVRSGALSIDADQDLQPQSPMRVEITIPALRRVSLNGSGNVTVEGGRGDTQLAINGSGDLRWSGQAAKLEMSINGSGDAALQGSATELAVHVSGSGNVNAKELRAHDVGVKIAGSGDVRVHLDGGKLRAKISGSGDVEWSGSGAVEQAVADGSGRIHKS